MDELLTLVRNSNNPDKAIEIAVKIIADFLAQHESSVQQDSACPQEHD